MSGMEKRSAKEVCIERIMQMTPEQADNFLVFMNERRRDYQGL